MTKSVLLAALALCTMFSAAAAPVKTIHGWNTWQRPGEGGKFERIKPNAELPQGAMKFLPDPDKKRYRIQWYRPFPAAQNDRLRVARRRGDTEASLVGC